MLNPKSTTSKETKKQTTFTSFSQMLELLPNNEACREFLEYVLWDGKPVCPHCGSENEDHYKLNIKGVFKGGYKCKDCREKFTVTIGTIFESSHIPLRKWFIALYIFSSHKKGISSLQLSRDLGITQKSAWFIIGRIRKAYEVDSELSEELEQKLCGVVECDETFIGGKNKNRHKNKRVKNAQGRSVKDKTPVFGLLSDGKVKTKVVANTQAETLKPIIKDMVEKGSIVVTDEWAAYNGLEKDYDRKVVKHDDNEYVRDGFHTNTIEGFWSLLKRGIFGIYHSVSKKHLSKYCDEFAFRYNTRKLTDGDRFNLTLSKVHKRTTYNDLIKKVN
jgi:transposase-like protein